MKGLGTAGLRGQSMKRTGWHSVIQCLVHTSSLNEGGVDETQRSPCPTVSSLPAF